MNGWTAGKKDCEISIHLSGPCDVCRKRADKAHIVTSGKLPDPNIKIFCFTCCPVHGRPPIAAD